MGQAGSRNSIKTPGPTDPHWPPIIGSAKVTPFVRVRDTVLTIIASILVGVLLWDLLDLLWDYFSYPIFTPFQNALVELAHAF